MTTPQFTPLDPPPRTEEPVRQARQFAAWLARRRTVRHFAPTPVPLELVESIIAAAATAPSGANKQPWRFVAVSDPALKSEIRVGAEAEEREFYSNRASRRWLDDLYALGTNDNKEFLETAPWLIAVFKLVHNDDGSQVYYVNESVGIAVGMLLTAAHHAGLATLTHTPSPMRFLGRILDRPANERPYLLIPIGYPAADCQVPDITRKPISEILVVRD